MKVSIKKNVNVDEQVIFIDGKFISSWGGLEIPEEIKTTLELMMENCFDEGMCYGRRDLADKIEMLL